VLDQLIHRRERQQLTAVTLVPCLGALRAPRWVLPTLGRLARRIDAWWSRRVPRTAVQPALQHSDPLILTRNTRLQPGELRAAGEPVRHQIEELPVISTQVIEHRCPRVRCPGCGKQTRVQLPGDIAHSAFGPRFEAAVAALSVRNRISRRDVAELGEELFGVRICVGTVDAILTRTADAMEHPYEDLLQRVRSSESLNMDETGWRLKGGQRALWGMFTKRHAVFALAPDRHETHAKRLLEGHAGIVTSDRWWAYAHLPLTRRQVWLVALEA
jgi:transposase